MPETAKRFKWTVEIEVDESWVADGFDLTDETAAEMLNGVLRWAYSHEFSAKGDEGPEPGSHPQGAGILPWVPR